MICNKKLVKKKDLLKNISYVVKNSSPFFPNLFYRLGNILETFENFF